LIKEASRITGLEENIPIAIGSGDGITTIFGLGTYADEQTGITVGSAVIIATVSKLFPEDKKQRSYVCCFPFCDDCILFQQPRPLEEFSDGIISL